MTLNYQAVISKNPSIGAEVARTGKMISFKEDEIPAYLLKSSPGAKAREASRLRYESRKNSCPNCHLALPATKVCDDCG